MGAFLFLNTAVTTVLSAAKNGLFLSVYSSDLIPQAVIAAALLTATIAVVFAGVLAGTARRGFAVGLTVVLGLTLVAGHFLFEARPRSAFFLFLWLSMVQALVVTHAWDYVGDMFTGRQARRLLPLMGMAASVGAILAGLGVAPAALALGTSNLLVIAMGLMLAALPCLWAVAEPTRETVEDAEDSGAVRTFLRGSSRGFRAIGSEPLLRVMALGLVGLTLAGTLIDLQLKFAVQRTFGRDSITAFYGIMAGITGTGTLLLQLFSSRVLFPRLGVSTTAIFHATTESVAALATALTGGIWPVAGLQVTDDVLQFSVQKPVEQVSLLPYPGHVKSAAVTTMGGVLRPLSKAGAGVIALLLVGHLGLLPWATVAAALFALVAYTRHRRAYLAALDDALSRQSVDLSFTDNTPLVVNREALTVIDRGLADPDPTVVVFSLSLLEQLLPADALPRAIGLLGHSAPEVRAEAALILGRLDVEEDPGLREALRDRLTVEPSPFVLASLLHTAGVRRDLDVQTLAGFLEHADARVRREALVALGKAGWESVAARLKDMLASDRSDDRSAAAAAAGDLGRVELMPALAAVVEDPIARPAALEALATMGEPAVGVLADLLGRRDLPLPLRRSIVTVLAGIEGPVAERVLLDLLDEPALGPPALTSLRRMRRARRMAPVDPTGLRPLLWKEIRKGFRYALIASALRDGGRDERGVFIADELVGLADRAVQRVLKVLALAYDEERLSAVEVALRSTDPALRSNALELLEGTLSPEDSRAVMPFAEASADGFGRDHLGTVVEDAGRVLDRPLESLLEEPDWWPHALALHALGRDDEIGTPGLAPASTQGSTAMIPLIEKVMILKGSQLFRDFPGSDLAGIASLAEVVHLEPDEVVFEQGDEGDAFYMVVRGGVRITRGSHELALLGPREGFGEMAILDQETRSATVSAAEATTLLRIDRDSFDRLIEQNPAVARGIYRVLTRRLRNTLAQVAAG
jgi:HEAT repeat protein